MRETPIALLRTLVTGDAVALARALHPRVVLHRADGTAVRGREAVIAALRDGEEPGGYVLRAETADALIVGRGVRGIPGELRFSLRGEVAQGRLIVVRVGV